MDSRLTFDQLSPGQTWTSLARTITESDVIAFATSTGDLNPLHVDRVYAEQSPWHQPVAHGLLGLSWAAGLSSQCPAIATAAFLGIRSWEFKRPLFFGDTVHVRTTVLEKDPSARRAGKVVWQLELINQHGDVAQQGCFETLVKVAGGRGKTRKTSEPHMLSRPRSSDVESSG